MSLGNAVFAALAVLIVPGALVDACSATGNGTRFTGS
jgi:hypothetical protein